MGNTLSKTTKAQYELFKKECDFWLNYFGLKYWHVEYGHEKLDGLKAQVAWKIAAKVAMIRLNTDWEDDRKYPIGDTAIKMTAFHEACELLLSNLNMMAMGKLSNHEDVVEEATHMIIRTLENTVFKEAI